MRLCVSLIVVVLLAASAATDGYNDSPPEAARGGYADSPAAAPAHGGHPDTAAAKYSQPSNSPASQDRPATQQNDLAAATGQLHHACFVQMYIYFISDLVGIFLLRTLNEIKHVGTLTYLRVDC